MFGLSDLDPAVSAAVWQQRVFLTELAGLFWLLAEIGILFAMVAARRHLITRPLPARIQWASLDWRRPLFVLAPFLVVTFMLVARQAGLPDIAALVRAGVHPDRVHDAFIQQASAHMKIWAACTAGWVILEIAIVYQGCRAYRAFREIVRPTATRPRKLTAASAMLIGGFAVLTAFQAAANPYTDALQQAFSEMTVYRSAMYLYLRMAGLVWIPVEWVAAILLWRASCLMVQASRAPFAPR